jgi:UTP-glucose-1-phosphate uridylyltransferase
MFTAPSNAWRRLNSFHRAAAPPDYPAHREALDKDREHNHEIGERQFQAARVASRQRQGQPSAAGDYGIVATSVINNRLSSVDAIVEKPKAGQAPSNLAVIGRYILTPAIFDKLENIPRGTGDEIQLTDAIAMLLEDETVLAYEFEGKRCDCGSKLGYLAATVKQSLKHPR